MGYFQFYVEMSWCYPITSTSLLLETNYDNYDNHDKMEGVAKTRRTFQIQELLKFERCLKSYRIDGVKYFQMYSFMFPTKYFIETFTDVHFIQMWNFRHITLEI